MNPLDLDNILRHLDEPPVDGIRMHPVTDAEIRIMVAELRAAWAFERFIRAHATDRHARALTLVENWDRLVASGDAYPGSEEER